jgi:hypothetical protein
MKHHHALRFLLIAGASSLLVASASAIDEVAGTLVTLTSTTTAPNGAWSWFQDERAIIDDSDPNNTLLLVSSVSSASSGNPENGDVDLLWLNLDTGAQGEFELRNQFERDDHDSAALYIRPDGRYLATYTRHGTDDFMYRRVSTNPNDPTSWGPEQSVDASGASSLNATYNNVHFLPNDNGGLGRLYDFTRAVGWNPTILTSYNDGDTWTQEGQLLGSSGSIRPYLRYFSDGNQVHFTATDGHPRDVNNSIYHGYVEDGQLFNSHGVVVDANLFDGSVILASSLTTVFAANTVFDGNSMTRAWNVDVAIESNGNPYCIFQARIDPGPLSGGQDSVDHQFFYARYNSGLNAWDVYSLAAAGRDIYAASPNGSEDDYTGLAALDPEDPNTVFISTPIDPRSDAPLPFYEIFRGVTSDGGATWTWDPITANSSVDNIRPLVPAWASTDTALVWMRGEYSSYTNWSTEVVAIAEITALMTVGAPPDPPAPTQVTYVDADTSNQATTNTTFADGSAFMPQITGGTVPADNQWWERQFLANDAEILAVNGGSDAPVLKTTITGLTPGTDYNVYAYYWWADTFGNGQWDLGAGFTQAGITHFFYDDGSAIADQATHFSNPPILIQEGNRDMYEYLVGTTRADGAGTIDVYIDDHPGNDDRTWYDGVGFTSLGVGENYCVANATSVSAGAQISSTGSASIAANDFVIRCTGVVPGEAGVFYFGPAQVQVPFGEGNRCVGGATIRLWPPIFSSAGGELVRPIDNSLPPTIGLLIDASTHNFQCWFRDPAGGPSGFNLSDGLEVIFSP